MGMLTGAACFDDEKSEKMPSDLALFHKSVLLFTRSQSVKHRHIGQAGMAFLCWLVASCSFLSTAVRPRSVTLSLYSSRMQLPAHLHEPYTRAEDAYLWANQEDDLEEVAKALGRGPKSCHLRLERLRNPKSSGHKRLFGSDDDQDDGAAKKLSLRPMRECIQRILYGGDLDGADFTIGYRDRFRDEPCEAPFDAPNKNVAGGERALVHALPEHRILYLKYKRRLVWHKEQRLDDVFGSR